MQSLSLVDKSQTVTSVPEPSLQLASLGRLLMGGQPFDSGDIF